MPTTLPAGLPEWLGTWLTAGIGVAFLLGLAMLLWGRVLHRGFIVLIAATLGLVAGGVVGPKIGTSVVVARLVGLVTFGLLALVLTRVVWAVLAGHVLASVAVAVVAVVAGVYLDVPAVASQPAANAQWLAEAHAASQQAGEALWAAHGAMLIAAAAVAGMIGLVGGFCLPRAAAICMTSLIGWSLVSAAAILAMRMWAPTLLTAAAANPRTSAGVGGALLLGGLIFQAVGEVRSGRAGEEDDGDGRQRKKAGSRAGE